MRNYIFEFNLESEKEEKETWRYYAVRYYRTDNGIMVEIGDGYRHNVHLTAEHWNRILRIIRDKEIDEEGVEAIMKGALAAGLRDEYADVLIEAIRRGEIKEAKG